MAKLKDLRLRCSVFCFALQNETQCVRGVWQTVTTLSLAQTMHPRPIGSGGRRGVVVARRSQSRGSKVCYSYNDPSGNMCNFDKCRFAHRHVRRITRAPSVGQMGQVMPQRGVKKGPASGKLS